MVTLTYVYGYLSCICQTPGTDGGREHVECVGHPPSNGVIEQGWFTSSSSMTEHCMTIHDSTMALFVQWKICCLPIMLQSPVALPITLESPYTFPQRLQYEMNCVALEQYGSTTLECLQLRQPYWGWTTISFLLCMVSYIRQAHTSKMNKMTAVLPNYCYYELHEGYALFFVVSCSWLDVLL